MGRQEQGGFCEGLLGTGICLGAGEEPSLESLVSEMSTQRSWHGLGYDLNTRSQEFTGILLKAPVKQQELRAWSQSDSTVSGRVFTLHVANPGRTPVRLLESHMVPRVCLE